MENVESENKTVMEKDSQTRKTQSHSRRILSSVCFWAWFFRILLILNLIPLAVTAFYAHPAGDDFAFSNYPHRAWVETHSLLAFFSGCAKQFHWNYFSWQGCYSAIVLGTLDPVAFGEKYYVLVPFILIGLFVLSNFVFFRTLAYHICCRGEKIQSVHLSRAYGDILASTACLSGILLIPRALDLFFWWDGAVNYLPFFAFLLLLGAVLMRYAGNGKLSVGFTVLGCLLSFVFVGGNYATALVNLLSLIFFGLLLLFREKNIYNNYPESKSGDVGKRNDHVRPQKAGPNPSGISISAKRSILPYVVILISAIAGLAVSVLAPGNSVRVADEGSAGIKSIPAAVLTSIRLSVDSIQDSMSLLLVLFLLMAAPFIWKLAGFHRNPGRDGDNKAASGSYSGILKSVLFYIILFLIYASSFAPSVYVYGDGGPMRLEDIRFLYLVFFLILAEMNLVRDLRFYMDMRYQKEEAIHDTKVNHSQESGNASGNKNEIAEEQESRAKSSPRSRLASYMAAVLILSILLTGFYYIIPRENRERLTSICAVRSLLIGETQGYDREMKEREAILGDPSTQGQDVVVQAVTYRPKLLFLLGLEMEDDPDNWLNQAVASFYGKKSVVLDDSNLLNNDLSLSDGS